jgi:hypothetical protein
MMSASMQGAMAFQKGLGAVHSLSHALGALPIGPHHGTLNAVLLPEVVKFNEAAVPDKVQGRSPMSSACAAARRWPPRSATSIDGSACRPGSAQWGSARTSTTTSRRTR